MGAKSPQTMRLEDATYWRARMADEEITADERSDFHAWLNANVENALAYDMADRLWDGVGALEGVLTPTNIPQTRPFFSRWRGVALPMVAAIAAFAAVIGLFLSTHSEPIGPVEAIPRLYATAIGETREIVLEDGSTITLGAKSSMEVIFEPRKRRVALSAGDALFDVAADAARPFLVTHDDLTVRVTGTKFDIRSSGAVTEVAVGEGSVTVSFPMVLPDVGDGQAIKIMQRNVLQAGDRVEASQDAGLGDVAQFDPASLGTWRSAQFAYADAPITEILADANRYTHYDILVEDTNALKAFRLSATFSADNVDQLIETLAYSYDLTVQKTAEGPLRIGLKK
ncbi:MAG: FecR domain-containing protein [Pseudomonadota bacterium]